MVDLITVRGQALLRDADLVVYAGSLVNPELLSLCKPGCAILDSAGMTLPEVIAALSARAPAKPSCGCTRAILPSTARFASRWTNCARGLFPLRSCPASVPSVPPLPLSKMEYTLPDVSQTVVITRMAGRTPVPEKESIRALAAHQATMVLFLSMGMLENLRDELIAGGYPPETPAAIVYKASWPDERIARGTLANLPALGEGISKTALVLVGRFLEGDYARSKLYDPTFTHGYRAAKP